jgi:copper(I)-binding protein
MKTVLIQLSIYLTAIIPSLTWASSIQVENAWIRAVPKNSKVSAGFMTLKNSTAKDIALTKVVAQISKVVELHTHTHENGVMKMRQVPQIVVAANSTTELKPKSYHVMFIDLTKEISEGDLIEIELSFDNGEQLKLKAPAKR